MRFFPDSDGTPEVLSEESKLGSGARFATLKAKLSGKKGVTDPGALAASIGRKKYGAKQMATWAAKNRRKKSSSS